MAQYGGGNLTATETVYFSEFKSYADGVPAGLTPMCDSLAISHQFNKLHKCLKAFEGAVNYQFDFTKAQYHMSKMIGFLEIGDEDAAFKEAATTLKLSSKYSVTVWKVMGMIEARRKNHSEAVEYIEKIKKHKMNMMGFISMSEDIMSDIRREAITHIYLEMGDSAEARATLNQPLSGKSIGERILLAAVNLLSHYNASSQSTIEKFVQLAPETLNVNKINDQKESFESTDWSYYSRVYGALLTAKISYQAGAYDDCENLLNKVLKEPYIMQHKSLYIESQLILAKISNIKGTQEAANDYRNKAQKEINANLKNISDPRLQELYRNRFNKFL